QRLLMTLDTPAANLALDEALLDLAEATGPAAEFVRIWESPRPVVVVGRSSRVHDEVDEAACRERDVPILRRSSGGAAIVAGPGCLMYAVVLSYGERPQLRDLTCAHAFVLDRLVEALRSEAPSITRQSTSDLAMIDLAGVLRKFSGNSLRAKRTHLLYHGTLLYDFDLPLIAELLRSPPRQPAYRGSREHAEFVANLPLVREAVEEAVLAAWPTSGELARWPRDGVARLVKERYGLDEWNLTYGRS
ncbi:MAG TPA: lipoate--protein ligase family protein, partial [Lacipirellulaceae bacterium]